MKRNYGSKSGSGNLSIIMEENVFKHRFSPSLKFNSALDSECFSGLAETETIKKQAEHFKTLYQGKVKEFHKNANYTSTFSISPVFN